jgi:hypothetical protein
MICVRRLAVLAAVIAGAAPAGAQSLGALAGKTIDFSEGGQLCAGKECGPYTNVGQIRLAAGRVFLSTDRTGAKGVVLELNRTVDLTRDARIPAGISVQGLTVRRGTGRATLTARRLTITVSVEVAGVMTNPPGPASVRLTFSNIFDIDQAAGTISGGRGVISGEFRLPTGRLPITGSTTLAGFSVR